MPALRRNSKLHARLGINYVEFLEHAITTIVRLFPHVQVSAWKEAGPLETSSKLTSNNHTICVTIAIGEQEEGGGRSLTSNVTRKSNLTMDTREEDICGLIAHRISTILAKPSASVVDRASVVAMIRAFDEDVVAEHIKRHHKLELDVASVFGALHTLSEQSYENKSLTFGCLIDSKDRAAPDGITFPAGFLVSKKYKALSDGFRTAYLLSANGKVEGIVNLDRYGHKAIDSSEHYFPDWSEQMARASQRGRCGISLNRQGDILVFEDGTLRFSYRYGRWQYWNHAQVIELLRQRAKVQKIPVEVLGHVVGSIYRAALDISFRRSGAMFVVLHRRVDLHKLVRLGDAIADSGRENVDVAFDATLENRTIQSLPRPIVVELASLDGSIVIENSGKIVAYGTVLQPRKTGKLHGTEGSRTKAAIGASNYGLAVKVSSDGDISVYHDGKLFIRV